MSPLNVFDPIDDLTPTELWSDIAQRRPGPEPQPPVSPHPTRDRRRCGLPHRGGCHRGSDRW